MNKQDIQSIKKDWDFEYAGNGGYIKRNVGSKVKMILNAFWFIPYLIFFVFVELIKNRKK